MKTNTKVRRMPALGIVWRTPYSVRHHARGVLFWIGLQMHEVVFEDKTIVHETSNLEEARHLAHKLNAAFNLGRASALSELA